MEIVYQPEFDEDTIGEMQDELSAKLENYGINTDDVLQKARENMTIWDGYFNENMTRGRDDMNFVLKDQWTSQERSEFNRLFKPSMTFNKLYDAIKKILGEQRKNKPDLMVRSLNGKSTQQQIDLRTDLVRTIAYNSQNDLVMQAAFKSALLMGFGAFEIVLEYETPKSFNKMIRYDIVPDATRVAFDPTAMKPHKGDGNYCGRQYVYTKEEFYATFPHISNPMSYSDPRSLLDFQWETRDTIVVLKYTQKEWFPVRILRLSNGNTVTEAEWDEMQKELELKKSLADGAQVVGGLIRDEIPHVLYDRKSQDYKIHQYMMTQNQIIDYTPWPSKYLPVIFVDGDSSFIQGTQYTKSFIHEAKDAQRFINYVGSEVAADIKNRRREQWLGTPDNIKGYEQLWRNPELQNGILVAQPDPKTGQLPQKVAAWDLSPALLTQYQRGNQDIREILGANENQEMQGRDMSGTARRERKMDSSMSTYVYFDNLNQAIEQSGRVILDLLPEVVGENERNMMVSRRDGRTESITMNKMTPDGIQNKLDEADYDIEIDTGPSYAVQKEVALEFLQQTLAANPQAFPLVADLWAKQLDVQFQPQLVERFQTLVPPDILAKEQGKPPPPAQPDPQAQMAQQQMQMQQAQIQNAQKDIEIKGQKLQLDQEANKLKQAQLMLDAQKAQMQSQVDVFNKKADIHQSMIAHGLDNQKLENDHSVKIAKILADLHNANQDRGHQHAMNEQKQGHAQQLTQQKALHNMQGATSADQTTDPDDILGQ